VSGDIINHPNISATPILEHKIQYLTALFKVLAV